MNAIQAAALAEESLPFAIKKQEEAVKYAKKRAEEEATAKQLKLDEEFKKRMASIHRTIKSACEGGSKKTWHGTSYEDEKQRIVDALVAEGYEAHVGRRDYKRTCYDADGGPCGDAYEYMEVYYISWEKVVVVNA